MSRCTATGNAPTPRACCSTVGYRCWIGRWDVFSDVAAGELLEQMLPWLSVGLLNCLERGGLQGVGSDRQPPSEDPDAPPGPLLSRRQGQVAELLKKGLRNRQIAQELGLSVHTVEIHVTAVLR
ncbi:MAG: LuxR C-terminal-related transcriptional regulator, partial [Polyangiaceae bacterium]|nr:LuxR C-terminal-related transcriptional regulator [Polyangiaceae bacterium]